MLSVLRSGVALLATVSLCESLCEDGSCSSSVELLQRGLVVDHAVKRQPASNISWTEYAKTMGSPTTRIKQNVQDVRPDSKEDGQYWKSGGMSDEEFLQDCKDVCAGNLDGFHCGGFAITNMHTRCFFYSTNNDFDPRGQGALPSWTFFGKEVSGSTECDFTNRQKCDDDGGMPAGAVMSRPECRDHCIAQGGSGQHGCCQYNDKNKKCRYWSADQAHQNATEYANNENKAAFIVDTCSSL